MKSTQGNDAYFFGNDFTGKRIARKFLLSFPANQMVDAILFDIRFLRKPIRQFKLRSNSAGIACTKRGEVAGTSEQCLLFYAGNDAAVFSDSSPPYQKFPRQGVPFLLRT